MEFDEERVGAAFRFDHQMRMRGTREREWDGQKSHCFVIFGPIGHAHMDGWMDWMLWRMIVPSPPFLPNI